MDLMQPTTLAGLVDAALSALERKAPLELVGAGTKRAVGRPLQTADVLDLSGLSGIESYEPAELVLSAGAGTRLAEIEAALAEAGQCLAFAPPDYAALLGLEPGRQTLGGIVATNLAGSRRLTAGAARDHVLGFHGVSGRGEAFKSGGKVVKNVTGYDLSKLVCGSWGTLAALAQIAIKVLPRAEAETTLLLQGLDATAAVAAMSRALGSPQEVSAAAWLPARLAAQRGGQGGAVTALRLEGLAASVRFRAEALLQLFAGRAPETRIEAEASQEFWRAIGNVEPLASETKRLVWKISVPPEAGPAVLAAFPEGEGFLDWGGGLVWLALPETPDAGAARIRGAIRAKGGHATLIRAPAAIRASVDVFEPQSGPLGELTRRVKTSFDPEMILNPGRLYAGI
jgi:glycolate oxidase FAD binding subunit